MSIYLSMCFLFAEPGYYEDGKFGIRLENIERVVPAETKYKLPIRKFLTFETVTMVPVQTKMLVPELLTEKEVSPPQFTSLSSVMCYFNNCHNFLFPDFVPEQLSHESS